MERFNLKKLNEADSKEEYHVKVSNRIAALEDLNAEVDINSFGKLLERISTFQQKGV
jgi:hypothetical protein